MIVTMTAMSPQVTARPAPIGSCSFANQYVDTPAHPANRTAIT